MRIGSLFSGIGGLELGLEWAGVGHTVFQVEQDPYCLAVLAKHWPDTQRFTDVRDVGAHNLPAVDVLCGGFPCQDISVAGKRAGIRGERSGLWAQYIRLVRELRPAYVVVENVADLLSLGLGVVLGDLAEGGYDAEWDCLPAYSVGAPHERDRVFVVAYPERERSATRAKGPVRQSTISDSDGQPAGDAARRTKLKSGIAWNGGWSGQSSLQRVDHGVPARVDRLRALGNSVVPQVAEVVGRRLVQLAGTA